MRIVLLILLFVVGCSRNNKNYIDSYRIPKEPSVINNQSVNLLPFKWEAPAYWLPNKKSAMRSASYLVPSANGSADLSVIYLNGDGGGAAANVNRWRKQLDLVELNKEEIINIGRNYEGRIGPYYVYEIINPENKESAFLCSIIPAKDFTIFVKLNTYPENLSNLTEEFINFSSSFNYNE